MCDTLHTSESEVVKMQFVYEKEMKRDQKTPFTMILKDHKVRHFETGAN